MIDDPLQAHLETRNFKAEYRLSDGTVDQARVFEKITEIVIGMIEAMIEVPGNGPDTVQRGVEIVETLREYSDDWEVVRPVALSIMDSPFSTAFVALLEAELIDDRPRYHA